MSNSSVSVETRGFQKTEATKPHNLGEPNPLRSDQVIRDETPREAREGPNRVGRVSGVAVDGRCIAPGSFWCQQRIQKKLEKVHFAGKIRAMAEAASPRRTNRAGQNWATIDRLGSAG